MTIIRRFVMDIELEDHDYEGFFESLGDLAWFWSIRQNFNLESGACPIGAELPHPPSCSPG